MSDPSFLSVAALLSGLGLLATGLTACIFGRARPLRSRRQGLAVLCAGAALMVLATTGSPGRAEAPQLGLRVAATTTTTSTTHTGSTAPSTSAAPTGDAAPTTTAPTGNATPTAGTAPTTTPALAAVGMLLVKGRGPKTGYTREAFGHAWFDADRNGCDTRNDILRRDLDAREMKNACKVLAGTLADPYTASAIRFEYGGASEVDIDHVVALSDAWQKGAARWRAGKRLAFANDPLNLLAADAPTNRSKGDGDTATWLPPNTAFRCAYVARQVAVKDKYAVSVTPAEKAAMTRVLSTCPTAVLPAPGPAPTVAVLPRTRATS